MRTRTKRAIEGPKKPEHRREVVNRRLSIPDVDWHDVRAGTKTELRYYERYASRQLAADIPVVGVRRGDKSRTMLLTIEDVFKEPLGVISPESLAREGFDNLGDFRRYWIGRHGGRNEGYRPLDLVYVIQLHPMTAEDEERFRERIWQTLFGEFA